MVTQATRDDILQYFRDYGNRIQTMRTDYLQLMRLELRTRHMTLNDAFSLCRFSNIELTEAERESLRYDSIH